MKKILIILFLILAFIGMASANTGSYYLPVSPGSWITYARYKITTHWDEKSYQLSVTSRTFVDYIVIDQEEYTCETCFGDNVLFRSFFPDRNSLVDCGGVDRYGQTYLGETRNQHGQITYPPIAKLAKQPYPGQIISECSNITAGCGFCDVIAMPNHCWSYRTINHFNFWGHFKDVWWTGLNEGDRNERYGQMHYNYVYARNIGLVHFWYADESGSGYEYYATDWGF